ncbi:hypothetical protein EDB83DRAFT_2323221 [Lactarius deliciosus]|nr:hypothetical protein EDB83DRAFT_2323221 [Lactarius deliciosus]
MNSDYEGGNYEDGDEDYGEYEATTKTTTHDHGPRSSELHAEPDHDHAPCNSLAVWRRKVAVSNSVRLSHLCEIELAKAALQKDYPDDNPVLVDEIRLTVTKTTA